jgi:stage II sporulation protein AB (anti-sigma F factor)
MRRKRNMGYGMNADDSLKEEASQREDSKKEVLRMEIESRSENEEFARVAVAVFMSRMNPTMEEIDDVKTAVSEAVTNGIIHGYQGKEGIIYIEAAVEGRELSVSVRDKGVGIRDVKRAMEPMYTSDVTGERSGMGFSFMEAFMDEIEVLSEPGKGTQVIMKKQIGR